MADKRKGGRPSFKKLLLVTVLIVVLLTAALLTGLYIYMKTQYLGRSNYVKSQGYTVNQKLQRETFVGENGEIQTETEAVLEEPVLSRTIARQEEALQGLPEIENAGSYNLLLIGIDGERETADSELVALLTLNSEREEACLTTFLPKLYVNIPQVGARQLKTVYAYGGAQLCVETLQRNYGVEIDHYILADLPALMEVLHQYDVELDVDQGEVTLEIGDTFSESMFRSLDSVASLLQTVLPCITHDMKDAELLKLLPRLSAWLDYSLKEQQLPYGDLYTAVNGILIPDMAETLKKLRETLY